MTLDGKRVVVLGGTNGIGFATARAAAEQGAAVVVASSRQATVDKALAELPAGTTGEAVDLADEAQVSALFDRLGEFDHLVFTAGEALRLGALSQLDLAAAKQFLNVRYWGSVTAVKYAAPRIRPGGSIVLTTGSASQRAQAGWALGASVCGAVESLARELAVELAPLRVTAVRPGLVRTDLWRDVPAGDRDALFTGYAQALPVGRVGEADDIALGYLYLMNQEYGTGTVLTVDGGGLLV
ncbi:MAG TPA: SDR family oxidoreductase [Pseudonocardiaceae bacterium]|jgi:NAD(P)-dependent dehydrogenase (short-subunit alcohol dehydrogenase family)|nr:SDR family oxidoreductase [Pseudonocardiaceae bacterium]